MSYSNNFFIICISAYEQVRAVARQTHPTQPLLSPRPSPKWCFWWQIIEGRSEMGSGTVRMGNTWRSRCQMKYFALRAPLGEVGCTGREYGGQRRCQDGLEHYFGLFTWGKTPFVSKKCIALNSVCTLVWRVSSRLSLLLPQAGSALITSPHPIDVGWILAQYHKKGVWRGAGTKETLDEGSPGCVGVRNLLWVNSSVCTCPGLKFTCALLLCMDLSLCAGHRRNFACLV